MPKFQVKATRFRHVVVNEDKTRTRRRYFRGDTIDLTDQEAERLLAVGAVVPAGQDDTEEATDEAPVTPAATSGQTVEEGQDEHPASSAEGTLSGEGEAGGSGEEGDGDDDYESWSYADLQAEAKERNLSAGGSKEDLVARLREDDDSDSE